MSSKRNNRREPPSGTVRGAGARRAATPWRLIATVLVALGVFTSAWLATRPRRPIVAAPAPDSLASMPTRQAYESGLQLMREHRNLECLAYFRRTNAGIGVDFDDFPELHYNYGGALYNTLFMADTIAGVARPRLRSSDERVAVMRECLTEFLAAKRLARTAADRAFYANRLAEVLQVWGFAWEAFVWYGEAARLDPADPLYRGHAASFQQIMSAPLHRPGETATAGDSLPG